MDGPDVLDPLVEAKLESLVTLVGLIQAGLEQRQREQLHQLQLQQQGSAASTSASTQLLQIQLQSQSGQLGQQRQQWQYEQHRQAVVVAEVQAAVAALGVQAAVPTKVQNWQEQQIGQLRHALEQLQQQLQLQLQLQQQQSERFGELGSKVRVTDLLIELHQGRQESLEITGKMGQQQHATQSLRDRLVEVGLMR